MKLTHLFFLLVFLKTVFTQASVSQLIIIKPYSPDKTLTEEDLEHFKITLYNSSRNDSLNLLRYHNCLFLNGKLPQYNGKFILFDKKINYYEVKIEHPKFTTSFHPLNKIEITTDSIDEFNKKHHIHIYKTEIKLEMECPEEEKFDFLYFSNQNPKGGFLHNNLIGVLFKDSLSTDSLKSISKDFKLSFHSKSYTGKQVIFQLDKGKLKSGKNKTIETLLLDSTRIKDVGIVVDTNKFEFFSSFYKIHAVEINQIKKWNMEAISGLKSFSKTMSYIKYNELEMGCGLYQNKLGLGINIIKYQNQTHQKELNDKCIERKKLKENDAEYVTLHTRNFSISGGEDLGKKKINNEKRMAEIHEEDKILKKEYNAPFGYIEPIVISAE